MILLSLTSYLTNFVCFPMFWTITEIPCDKKNIHLFWASLVSKPLVVPEGCSARMFFQGWISSALFSIGMLIVGVMIAVHFLAPWLHGTSSSHPSHPWDPPKPLVALSLPRLSEASVWFVAGDVAGGWAQVEGLTEASFAQQYTRSVEWAVSRSCQFMEF